MSFAKLSSRITKSSIWEEDDYVIRVWVAFLAEKDENGYVESSYQAMRRICNIKNDDDGSKFDTAINILESEDAASKTPDNDGRRIERVQGGWIVLNHDKYRLREDVIKDQTKERVRRYRNKYKNVTQCNVTETLPSVSVSVSESVSEFKEEVQREIIVDPKWAENSEAGFAAYLSESEPVWDALQKNWAWIEKMKNWHPNTNIRESMEKSYENFWGERDGWQNKRSAYLAAKQKWIRSGCSGKFEYRIDWEKTVQKTLSLSRVPIPFGVPDQEKITIEMFKRRTENEKTIGK